MYHIKDDKRCHKSAQVISDALSELLPRKPYPDISITDIQRISGVGRSTFYRLFDNIDDVVVYKVEMILVEMLRDVQSMSLHVFISGFLELVIERNESLISIVTAGRTDLIVHTMRRKLENMVMEGKIKDDDNLRYRLAVFIGAAITVITVWNENGRKESIDDLRGIMESYLNMDSIKNSHS